MKALCSEVMTKNAEHHIVFESFVQSTIQMLEFMQPRHQKTFTKRIKDAVVGLKILGQTHEQKEAEWELLQASSAEISKVQDSIDKTLDKVRGQMLEKRVEAESMLQKYCMMLQMGENKLQESRKEGSLFDLSQDSSKGLDQSKSYKDSLVDQISSLEEQVGKIESSTFEFFSMIKQLSREHFNWLNKQKYEVKVTPIEPMSLKELMQQPGTKWSSPTATTTAKMFFFADNCGSKPLSRKNNLNEGL